MKYQNIIEGRFVERVNRFIARVEVENEEVLCHVKNTGRCRELFVKGTRVCLEKNDNPKRKTVYSLISVEKDGALVNVDSQAPNKMVKEWLEKTEAGIITLRPETVFGNSRFDFYLETAEKREWIEVKGVTLVEDGVARFPDAPTERGIKHMEELCQAVEEGYQARLIFVIQRKDAVLFEANRERHPAFAEVLARAVEKGVHISAYDSIITEDEAFICEKVKIRI